MVDVEYTSKKVQLIARRSKRYVIVSKCIVGDTIKIKCPDAEEFESYKCIKKSSNGRYRFKGEVCGRIETYEACEMKKAKKNYEIMEKIDALLEEHGY